MLLRFSLYGFLKNQRYFEPFLLLVFIEKGLTFFQAGILIAFHALVTNLLEIPSGALADTWGRRRTMILSFCGYIASFLLLGWADGLPLLFAGMGCFAIGDSFRTGTHKAMIFAWLKQEGRTAEKTRYYGYTRSWSKIGSAVSVLVAAAIVYFSSSYEYAFYVATIPYALGIVNFLGYPKELDELRGEAISFGAVWRKLVASLREAMRQPPLRRLMAESMGFEGVFGAVKDYIQPVLKAAALAAAAAWVSADGMSDIQKTTLLIGPVYLVLYLMAAWASRWSHRLQDKAMGEERVSRWLWAAGAGVYALMLAGGWWNWTLLLIAAYVALYVLQNLWRPVLIARFDTHGSENQGATLLSIESQAKGLATMVIAPLLGLAVDLVQTRGWGGAFWPVGAAGLAVTLVFALRPRQVSAEVHPSRA